jgi:hypothetical protein
VFLHLAQGSDPSENIQEKQRWQRIRRHAGPMREFEEAKIAAGKVTILEPNWGH